MNSTQLRTVLAQTLVPNADARKAAEEQLSQAQKVSGHPLEVLRLIANKNETDANVQQAAAVHFKNIVKKGWNEDAEDGTDGIQISLNDRNLIKSNLVELMCTVPPKIQSQCSEAISLIAAVDYPKKWDNLLPELLQKFQSEDQTVVNGCLETANSIFKRFRYINRSDELYEDILYTLGKLQEPLLIMFKATGQKVEAYKNDLRNLLPVMKTLHSLCGIFYSLNYQDLPEYFEDHIGEWMAEFAKYLSFDNKILLDEDEEDEPSPIDTLQAAIVDNLALYADKDEEPFIPFVSQFTSLVWNLLLGMSSFPKHDVLATTCIKFLSSLVGKLMHKQVFEAEETLRQIIAKIVIPNLMIRDTDEEKFEDDHAEFIMEDMEGGDTESRRRRSQELLRAMCRHFDNETTVICMEHIQSMLGEFAASPSDKWKAKDAAIHLMLGIAVKAESNKGVSAVNDKVNVMEFFTSHILTELQDANHASRPMVKATSIKFVSTFRNQFSTEHMVALMPVLINHLSSPSVVVHTYSAAAIERFMACKVTTNEGGQQNKFGGENIKPFLEPLFTSLFAIVDNAEWNENEYVMKCIMRSLITAKDDVVQVTEIVLQKLNEALSRVAKNPRNPQFNHYMFESIAVLVKSVCSKYPEHTASFESLLFPPFQTVLQMDVSEFTPYVFQILAQLLEYRPGESGLGEAYTMLFTPLLTPDLWERKGNIPALTRLLQAYVTKGINEIVGNGQLNSILGIFQKLISSKATEVNAFELLSTIIHFTSDDALKPLEKDLFQVLLMRLQRGKTARYIRLFTGFLAQYIGKKGGQQTLDLLNQIQPGLSLMLLKQIWLPRLSSDPPNRREHKTQIVGLTKVLCDTPAIFNDENGNEIWMGTLAASLKLVDPNSNPSASSIGDENEEPETITYDAAFSRLHFASKKPLDPFSEVKDTAIYLATSLHQLHVTNPNVIQGLFVRSFQADPKLSPMLDTILQKAGVRLTQ